MKFETTAGTFSAAVSSVIAATGRDGVMSHIGITGTSGFAQLSACNGELALSTVMTVNGVEDGSTTLPAKKLSQILKNLNPDATVKVEHKDGSCLIKSGRSRFKLATLSFGDMPTLTPDDSHVELALPDLIEGISRTKHSMAKADVRFYLNGLLIQNDGNTTRLVATDGHRMSVCDLGRSTDPVNAIIPNKAVAELTKALRDGSVLRVGSTVLQVVGDVTLTTKLLDGRFPDWTRVVPDNKIRIAVDALKLKASVQRVGVLSNDEYHGVRLAFGKGVLTLSASNPDREDATDEIDIDYDGDVIEIGFNAKYLADALAVVTGDCLIHITDGQGSILITDESSTRHVVMPMRL